MLRDHLVRGIFPASGLRAIFARVGDTARMARLLHGLAPTGAGDPAHPWTNGHGAGLRLFKETVFRRFWLIAGHGQLHRFCADFLLWHNRDRPHGGWEGRTPDEVFFERPVQLRPHGPAAYFDGTLPWYRFG